MGADSGPDQAYTLEPVGTHYEIRARHSGKLLIVAAGSTADGAQVIQWPDQDLPEQQWSLVPVSSWPRTATTRSTRSGEGHRRGRRPFPDPAAPTARR